MFNKLRNRFLILNLIIISVMMLISFVSIYFITYQNVRSNINAELHKTFELYSRPNERFEEPQSPFDDSQIIPSDDFDKQNQRFASFSLLTDKHWNVINKSSTFNINNKALESAKASAISQKKETGTFTQGNTHWAFSINPTDDGYRIIFADITSEQEILINLIDTFLIVALVMLIFIYIISRFFANRSIKPIKEAFEKQQQFVADASHELKTPLAIISTNIDALLSNSNDTIESQSKWLNYMKSETERMSKLTNDLLYLAKMDYSDIKMIFAKFNLSEAVENIILTMEAVIYEHDISLNYDIEPNLIAFGNSEQIKQVIMILLDNATKYSNAKGTINILLKKRHNDIVLSVANTGEGISEDNLERIFDRFYRTDKSRTRKSGGYGLGLAIAKAIINQHKGKIYTKSILNESTTFFVELPVVK